MTETVNNCPFCDISFKSLGHHIYRCKFRERREYRQYLKTRGKTGDDYLSRLISQAVPTDPSNPCGVFHCPAYPSWSQWNTCHYPTQITACMAWEATNTFSTHLLHHLMSLDDPDAINSKLTIGMYSISMKHMTCNHLEFPRLWEERRSMIGYHLRREVFPLQPKVSACWEGGYAVFQCSHFVHSVTLHYKITRMSCDNGCSACPQLLLLVISVWIVVVRDILARRKL